MAEIKAITEDYINNLSSETRFNSVLLLKDYNITAILYFLKDVEGIYFKGGTALQRIFLDYPRISEDIDFTLTKNIEKVKHEIKEILKKSKLFEKISKDKDVGGFTRMIVHYKGFYGEAGVVFIDLNERAKLLMEPERHEIRHFYNGFIPNFSLNTLSKEEMVAEKLAAAIGRNMPRDHYDIYKIIKKKIPLNLGMAKKKCQSSGYEFSIIRMFNNAKKLKNRWDEDLLPLLSEEASFQEVIKILAKHFKLKEEKEKIKNKGKVSR